MRTFVPIAILLFITVEIFRLPIDNETYVATIRNPVSVQDNVIDGKYKCDVIYSSNIPGYYRNLYTKQVRGKTECYLKDGL